MALPPLDETYRNAWLRITDVAGQLDGAQLGLTVPATPEWTVHDVLAHLVGVAADGVSGRLEGAASDDWTARHVDERRDRSVQDLLAEWQEFAPAVASSLAGQRFTGPNAAADVICHESDLREALGLRSVDREHWEEPFLSTMMGLLGARLKDIATVSVTDERDGTWHCGSGEHQTALRTTGYELFRAMFSRRSRRQIAGWDWASAPTDPLVDCFGVFGPRDDDQPIPPA